MCGIWALLSLKSLEFDKSYDEKYMKIKNRGPDRTHTIQDNQVNIMLAFHRLSIMDTSTKGDQPFVIELENRTIYSICNGEIYNHHKLIEKYNLQMTSHSDCEVIPRLYCWYLENNNNLKDFITDIDGEYAFILLDIDRKQGTYKVIISTDRFGIRPLFISYNQDYISLSSELKGLLYDETSQVERFKPRHYMIINYNKKFDYQYHQYYDLMDFNNTKYYDLDMIKKNIRKLLTNAIINRLETNRPLGCLLSGGLDSSLVASIASKYLREHGQTLKTFSVGMPGSTDKYFAEKVAEFIQSEHTHIELPQEDWYNAIHNIIYYIESYDTTTVRASTGQYLVSKWINENTDIKVLLIGDGSDELAAGYMYFHKAPTAIESHLENIRLLEDIHYYDVLRADRGIAENGLEARVPFLDRKFVEYYLQCDPELRVPQHNVEKWLLRESFNTGEYLPQEVLWRKKEAFSDGVSGLEKSWYSVLQDYVEDKYTQKDLEEAKSKYEFNTPLTKESLYFREIFNNLYTKNNKSVEKVIPYFWLPKWCGNVIDPSARVLSVYNEINKKI
jgi:asparagine synthase (glutamine-hydrolysing)